METKSKPVETPEEKRKKIVELIHPNQVAVTISQAAALLNTSVPSVRRLIKRKLIRSSGALRRKLIPRAEVDRFVRET
jgi:excisionase family DNA binding protein